MRSIASFVGSSNNRLWGHLSSNGRKIALLATTSGSINIVPQKIAILGGGLAGMSTAYHLLKKTKGMVQINVLDRTQIGCGGASAVAGGLLHPLSPRGKLLHLGMEGLKETNQMISVASQYNENVVLRNALYRIAIKEQQVQELQNAAKQFPHFCHWMEKNDIETVTKCTNTMGGLKLFNGCQVIHVPSYLKGLWSACREMNNDIQWNIIDKDNNDDGIIHVDKKDYDAIVYAGGAGMMQDGTLSLAKKLPVQLVRGQSVLVQPQQSDNDDDNSFKESALCGKYMSPTPDGSLILVGASHEFGPEPWEQQRLVKELRQRCDSFMLPLWEQSTVQQVTCGWRVQSKRSALGRHPIVGHLRDNEWIYTGLSSRGILYHGLYGNVLADLILNNNNNRKHQLEVGLSRQELLLDWWREIK